MPKPQRPPIKLPLWVKTKIIAPFVLISVFLTGAFFQLNFPLFKNPETAVEYNSATLSAHEKWQIEQHTCNSMRKIGAMDSVYVAKESQIGFRGKLFVEGKFLWDKPNLGTIT